jgi:hypothetical protein
VIIEFDRYRHRKSFARLVMALSARRLHVTSMDLASGRPGSPSQCPVALAIRRMFPKAVEIGVSGGTVRVSYPDYSDRWDGGAELRAYIIDIDRGVASGEVPHNLSARSFTLRLVARKAHRNGRKMLPGEPPNITSQ